MRQPSRNGRRSSVNEGTRRGTSNRSNSSDQGRRDDNDRYDEDFEDQYDDEEYDEDTDSYSVQQHNPRGIGVLNRGVDKPQLPSKVQPSVQHQRAHSYQQPSMLDERHGQPPIPNQYYNEQPNYSNGISLHNPYQEEPSYISVKQSQQMPYMQQQNRMNNRASNSHQYPYNAPNNNYNPQQRMIPNRNNILTAVLSLLQELDPERLRIIKQECDKLTMYQ